MNDKIFGELVFNNGWEKEISCDFWGLRKVKIRISAYENEKPNNDQRDSYNRFIDDMKQISALSYKKLEEYLHIIENDIIVYCGLSKFPSDIKKIVSVNHILFMESGNFAIMCDAKWDDHGVAVLCTETEVIAGPQDIVWMNE
jgi:hypothetical protein